MNCYFLVELFGAPGESLLDQRSDIGESVDEGEGKGQRWEVCASIGHIRTFMCVRGSVSAELLTYLFVWTGILTELPSSRRVQGKCAEDHAAESMVCGGAALAPGPGSDTSF